MLSILLQKLKWGLSFLFSAKQREFREDEEFFEKKGRLPLQTSKKSQKNKPEHVFQSVLDPECTHCGSTENIKRGTRKTKKGRVQLYRCRECERTFTPDSITGKHFNRIVILEALIFYQLGFSLEDTARILKAKFEVAVAPSTISEWVEEYTWLCPYSRMRPYGKKMYHPKDICETYSMAHRQIYKFRFHKAKTRLILEEDYRHRNFDSILEYLENVTSETPHQLFQDGERASRAPLKFSKKQMIVRGKRNYATKLASFVLSGVQNRNMRHEALQRFMIATDSVTVATEVPVYIRKEDLVHMKTQLGFELYTRRDEEDKKEIRAMYTEQEKKEEKKKSSKKAKKEENEKWFNIRYRIAEIDDLPDLVTGHIDFLQIRNGSIHILDYKGEGADNVKPIEQLTIYALALSRLTGLRVYHFKCAWFDEKTYHEFFPLHVVYKKKKGRRKKVKTKEGIYKLNEKAGRIDDMKPMA
ncbi:MAG: PD-(D/E)XK nuclease family protein [Candidatus Paceibacterota bacterium]